MRILNCNFETWTKNHTPEHKDRIFRELYPFQVFEQIKFDVSELNHEQMVFSNDLQYSVVIRKIELQDNGRYRTTFEIKSVIKSNTQTWKTISWNATFQIIYTKENEFITVYTKNEDASKEHLRLFFRGSFGKIVKNRSLSVSYLLFRSLVLNICEDMFGPGKRYEEFQYIPEGIRDIPPHPNFKRAHFDKFVPFYSKGRSLWVCISFNEDKAHRIGILNRNQCEKLFIVYCNPTYTKHQRCQYDGVQIVSLFEFVYINSRRICGIYAAQIRLLQNHLNNNPVYSITELKHAIECPSHNEYEILKSELMEALAIMKIIPLNSYDLLLYLSAMNLLNAWINRNRRQSKKNKLISDMYSFKQFLSRTVSYLVSTDNLGSFIYIENDLIIIEFCGFQFSFHNIPFTDQTINYMNSAANCTIEWKGIKLQPIAPLVFRYVMALNNNLGDVSSQQYNNLPLNHKL